MPIYSRSLKAGHARPSITLDVYSHLISDKLSDLAEMMDDLITPTVLDPTATDQASNPAAEIQTPHI